MNLKLGTGTGLIFDKFLNGGFLLSSALLIFILLSLCAEVVMRYFVGHPFGWVIEVVSLSLIFIPFLGAAWLLKKDGHVKMELVLECLNPRAQSMLNIFTSVLSALLWLVIAWYGGEVTFGAFQSGEHIPLSILEPLKAPLFMIIPIGSFLLFIQSIRNIFRYLRSWRASPKQT